MTPAQLEHLRKIDAHLEKLLSQAEKRTPGRWEWTDANRTGEPQLTCAGGALVCTVHHECVKPVAELNGCADFIASCAGNAEAGWRYVRQEIEDWFLVFDTTDHKDLDIPALNRLLAAFPLELIEE
jgi:hypothetical protein